MDLFRWVRAWICAYFGGSGSGFGPISVGTGLDLGLFWGSRFGFGPIWGSGPGFGSILVGEAWLWAYLGDPGLDLASRVETRKPLWSAT